jgi:hypothetical protein
VCNPPRTCNREQDRDEGIIAARKTLQTNALPFQLIVLSHPDPEAIAAGKKAKHAVLPCFATICPAN